MKDVFIVLAKRTPIGGFFGNFSHISATDLMSTVLQSAISDLQIPKDEVNSVYLGNVLSANLGQSPARQAALKAGIPNNVDCTTINKVCASGMKATMLGAQQIQLGLEDIVVTGGFESMSNVPHYIMNRKVNKLGHEFLVDGLLKDGLTDAIGEFHMGVAAELCAEKYNLTREQQDEYALESYRKAVQATKNGKFSNEIITIDIATKNGIITIDQDEDIYKIVEEKVAKLKPVFKEGGTITAANASNLNDGAAVLVLASRNAIEKYNLKPLAKIIDFADAAQEPEWFTTAPSIAIPKALDFSNLTTDDIDFFEINEAYSAVALANMKELNLNPMKVNVYGGAIALGHPLGASGARILCTLISVLHQENGKYGVAAICNGGGGASAMVLEKM